MRSDSRADETAVLPAISWSPADPSRTDAVGLLTAYAVLLMLIPASLIFTPLGGTGTPATVFAFCILLWYLASWVTGRLKPYGGSHLVRVAMFIFVLAVLASFVAAVTRDITEPEVLAADSALVWLGCGAALVVVACGAITEYDRLEVLLRRLVILGAVVSAVAILQFRGIDLTKLIHIPGLSVNTANTSYSGSVNGYSRAMGTASQPIEFGVVLAMLLPLALQQAFNPSIGGRFGRWAPVTLIAVAAPLTIARSAIIGLAIVFLVLFPTWRPRRRLNVLCVLIIGVGFMHILVHGLIGTFIALFEGIFNGQNSSVNDRVADYAGVAQYVAERPIFGRGIGTFLPLMYRYTDNMYLLGIVEIGIVGVVAMFFLFIAGIQAAALGRRRARGEYREYRRETGMALVASMAVALVTSGTFDSLTFPMFSGLFFLLLGCCGAYYSIMTRDALLPTFDPVIPFAQSSGRTSGRAAPVPGR
jgi:polysaccharide biosynthesis protein PslJ